jgi:crossover junction endodeoxyribonuclease RuvC
VFGIDPGSLRTGYGCVESDGTRHRLIACGALTTPTGASLAEKLQFIYRGLGRLLAETAPAHVAIESLFYARNARSALVLGHARGVAVLSAIEAGVPVAEYTPAEVKVALAGYGRAEKRQLQRMVMLLLGLDTAPTPLDASDALAIAICHAHSARAAGLSAGPRAPLAARSWRHVRLPLPARRPVP